MNIYNEHGVLLWIGSAESAHEFMKDIDMLNNYELNGVPSSVMERLGTTTGDATDERFGEYADFINMEGSLAIVPIKGKLASKENWLTRMFGIMTYETLSNVLATITADGGVTDVLLDVDSPGGMAKGIEIGAEAIEATKEAGIPVSTHTSSEMASAAYWLGSAGDPIMASEHAEVGSIGVIAVHTEYVEAFKKAGIKHTVMRKGDEKALATPFEKLSAPAKAQIDASMERSYQSFIGAVSDNTGLPRDYVAENLATGKMFTAEEALGVNMINEIVSYNDAVNNIVSNQGGSDGASSNSAPNQNWSKAAMTIKTEIPAPPKTPAELAAEQAATAVAAGVPAETIPAAPAPEAPAAPAASSEDATVTVVEDPPAAPPEANSGEPGDGTPAPAPVAEDGTAALLADINKQLIEAKVELAAANAKVIELGAGNKGFKKIAVEQTQRMRVALGLSGNTEDLEKMGDAALVTAHEEVRGNYMTKFTVGATSRTPDDEPKLPGNVVTRIDQAVKRATSFK